MTKYTRPVSKYDRVAIITPDSSNPGEFLNLGMDLRAIWTPTYLAELVSSGQGEQQGNTNQWDLTTILGSDECAWNNSNQKFELLRDGLFEINVFGETTAQDYYGANSYTPYGHVGLEVQLNRLYDEVMPRAVNPGNDMVRVRSHYSDEYTCQNGIGFTEKFYINLSPDNVGSSTYSQFHVYSVIKSGVAGSTRFKTRMGLSVKRIWEGKYNFGSISGFGSATVG